MSTMVPFKYGGFWDVPRDLVLRYRDRSFRLHSYFDDDLDDYPDVYEIDELSDVDESAVLDAKWDLLRNATIIHLGSIPIQRVTFDERKRELIDATFLDQWIDSNGSSSADGAPA